MQIQAIATPGLKQVIQLKKSSSSEGPFKWFIVAQYTYEYSAKSVEVQTRNISVTSKGAEEKETPLKCFESFSNN